MNVVQFHDLLSAVIGSVLTGVLIFLTVGIFKLVSTVNDLSNRVSRIEGWIWPRIHHSTQRKDE